jgi:hypothetical protein
MIRVDEIYSNVFWPWFETHRPGTRLFFCDPPGHSSPEHLFNLGHDDIVETDYVFFHDQEPVDIDLFRNLFDEVAARNQDIQQPLGPYTDMAFPAHIVVSERGEYVQKMQDHYGWISHYYFYHGWACQDWFRGYDRTFLLPRARDRNPKVTFMCPNRIIAGKRDHRVLFLYHLFKQNLAHNHISAPRICPAESVDIVSIAQKYTNVYHDMADILEHSELPRVFHGEETQQMASCWLTNFTEAKNSLVYVPTETVYFGQRTHITEKTFKAIALEMPFVLIAPAGSLEYLREYGFKTFDSVFDESYDQEQDDLKRLELATKLLKDLDNLSDRERNQIHRACLPIVEHNFNHFYRGGFTDTLWTELTNMLKELHV